MKDYSQILSKIVSTPWLMEPGALRMMLEIIDAHMSGRLTQQELDLRMQAAQAHPNNGARAGAVGVLPLYGPIFPRANLMTEMSGATSLEQFQGQFRQMMADDSISSIILDVDSPGGMSDLVPEMSDEIRQARDRKPIFSIANTAANSAAYMLASQATKMYASKSAQVGSIGTYLVHTDESGALEQEGIKQTVIKAGRFKAAMIEPLTSETRGMLQNFVNETNKGFIEAVSLGRGVSVDHVNQHFGEGGVLTAQSALDVGMIDEIATFEEVAGQAAEQRSGLSVSMAGTKQSYDADKEHSEPGTGLGGEPIPREPPEKDDPAIVGGWRRQPPPIAFEEEEDTVNRDWLEARAQSLGIEFTGETTDEELATMVAAKVDDIVVPLASAAASVQSTRQLAIDYPEVAERLERLERENRASEAKTFADSYATIVGTGGGLSTLCRDVIKESFEKIDARQFTQDDLKTLLDTVTAKNAHVPMGEKGSSRAPTDEPGAVTGDFRQDRQEFARLVQAAMKEDNLDQRAAIKLVSEQNPELAEAYRTGHVTR